MNPKDIPFAQKEVNFKLTYKTNIQKDIVYPQPILSNVPPLYMDNLFNIYEPP